MCECFGIIYKVTNLINGKCYIGKTTQTLNARKSDHKGYAKRNGSDYFHKAIKKYGLDNFKWEILCEDVPILFLGIRETMKIIVENSHISTGRGYNLTWGGEGTSGYKHTEETRRKMMKPKSEEAKKHMMKPKSEEAKKHMSIAQKEKTGEKNNFYGRKHSEEAKRKMREKKLGKIVSDETKKKLSKALMGNKNAKAI